MRELYNFSTMYLLTFFFVCGFVLVDYGMAFIDLEVQSVIDDMEKKIKLKETKLIETQRANKQKKLTTYKHAGYGFSGAAGHDLLITDSLMNRITQAVVKHISSNTMFAVNDYSQNIAGGLSNSHS